MKNIQDHDFYIEARYTVPETRGLSIEGASGCFVSGSEAALYKDATRLLKYCDSVGAVDVSIIAYRYGAPLFTITA